ncbi:hypothetical protein V6X62_01610 [Spiribacter sp. 218]|uniref:hypothetical protein n=1 Tax=Spiribacter pallidus TaxID=1987936 RepID=UPI00349F2B0E
MNELTEVQKLALLEAERRAVLAVHGWLQARVQVEEGRKAAASTDRAVKYAVIAGFIIISAYQLFEWLMPIVSFTPTVELGGVLLIGFSVYIAIQDQRRVKVLLAKAERAEQRSYAELRSLVPSIAHLLYKEWSTNSPIDVHFIRQESAFQRITEDLITEIHSSVASPILKFMPTINESD